MAGESLDEDIDRRTFERRTRHIIVSGRPLRFAPLASRKLREPLPAETSAALGRILATLALEDGDG